MTMHDRVLQNAYRAWMARALSEVEGQTDPSAHLDEAAWERLATNELTESERDGLLRHVMACADCSEIWKALLALRHDAAAEGLIPATVQTRRPLWRSPFIPLALAATAILAVSGVLVVRQPAPGTATATVRSGGALAAVEGLMVADTSDGVPAFVWTPVPEATHYKIEVFFEDGRPHWTNDAVGAPPTRWPADVSRSKGAYRWRVEAHGANGAVARSRLMVMELSR